MVLDNVRKSIFGWARQSTGSFTDGSFDPRGSIHGMKGFHKMDDDENWAQQREPAHLQRNKTERRRLQGLMRSDSSMSKLSTPSLKDGNTFMQRMNVWMINEGKRQTFVAIWILCVGTLRARDDTDGDTVDNAWRSPLLFFIITSKTTSQAREERSVIPTQQPEAVPLFFKSTSLSFFCLYVGTLSATFDGRL